MDKVTGNTATGNTVNDHPPPRNADVQLSERYMELKRTIWDSVQAEVMKSMEVEAD